MDQAIKALRIKYLGKTPRTFALPIPFVSHSERTGQVTCDPIGEFPAEDGKRLLELSGDAFELVETVYETTTTTNGKSIDNPLCECGCGDRVTKPTNRFILGHSTRMKPSEDANPAT